jgi:GNAT superfamily N-acetyltransferase
MVALVGDEIASHVAVRRGDVWIGGFAFPAVRLGAISTHPRFRRQRIASALVDKACTEARKGEALLAVAYPNRVCASMLLGLGFCRGVYSKPAWQLDLGKASEGALTRAINAAGKYGFRPAAVADAKALADLYFQHFSQLAGCWSRNDLFWQRRLEGASTLWFQPSPEFFVAADDERTLAYVAVAKSRDRWDVIEFACVAGHENVVAGGCARLAQEAQESGVKFLGIDVSYADPMARELVPLGLRGHVKYEDVHLRILDPAAVTSRCIEVVDLKAIAGNVSGVLAVEGQQEHAFGTGESDFTIRILPEDLMTAVFNGASLQGILGSGRASVQPPGGIANAAMRQLFPESHAFTSRLDLY